MKILYHHRIASKDGQYVHVEELTNALIEQGHQIDFICPEFAKETDFGNEGGFVIKLKSRLPKSLYEILELCYSLVIAVKLIKQILKNKPDFIYERYNLYQPVGVVIAKLFRIPILLEVNAPLVDERMKYSGLALARFARVIENFTWKHATYVLPVTRVLGDIIAKTGVDPAKIVVIHNGINQSVFEKILQNKKQGHIDTLTIGFTGFINPWHRLDLAIDAIAELKHKNIHMLCVGEGDIRPELEARAKQQGVADRITFTGLVDRQKVFEFVSTFDIALQPAVTEYASPLKLFEYLAVGSLIIAPATPNILEILDSTNAILFDPKIEGDFKQKLIQAIEHIDDYSALRENAQNTIINKSFTWQSNAQKVVMLVKNLTATS
jgi:glycosyltransferase involved in cell wall biosynthesis